MTSAFKLRPYQRAAVSSVVHRYREQKQRRMLLFLPTGAGKTVIATFIIKALLKKRHFGKVLFVAHRREILDQTARTFRRHLSHRSVQIEQGERTADGDADITVASVQSLVRRKERYNPNDFSLIICDECHRALAPSWEEVIRYFHEGTSEETLLLGMTATPRRTDGKSAVDVFGRCAYEISRTDLEDLGYLVPMSYFTVRSNLDLARVKMSGGDFQVGALSTVMDSAEVRALTVKAWLEQGQSKRTIAFCAGVDHAHHLAEDLLALGIPADKIDGKTKERKKILKRFREGEIQVLTNYGVLTEGFDDPGVECILMARPTTSPLVYTQCIGRGLRSAPGKRGCTVIDIVDRSTHQLQYGAAEMAGLSPRWRCRGGDPFRQAKSLAGIKVTSKEAFLSIRNAATLEEVQSILMRLPPNVVVAGLDGEPVLRYQTAEAVCTEGDALKQVRALLRQAKVRGAKVVVEGDHIEIKLRSPETENERFAYLKWHLERVSGRTVSFSPPRKRRKWSNPRALLKSLLPDGCRITHFSANPDDDSIEAIVTGLTPGVVDEVVDDFFNAYGVALDLKGQMALF